MTIMCAITILLGGVMAPQQQKASYPFISTILSHTEGNLEFKEAVCGNPQAYFVFEEGHIYGVEAVVRYMYIARGQDGKSLADLVGPIMFNPSFIMQIIAQTGNDPEMGHSCKGDIWQWSGVQQRPDLNSQVRPTISWNK